MRSLCYVPNVNHQEQGEVKATFPATDIRYRGVFDKNVTITVDTITVDTVTMDPMACMDTSTSNSGIVGDSLFDTIEQIEQDVGTSDLFVPDADLSLDGLMGAMEDTNSAHNMELSVTEVIVEADSVMNEKSEVKCESSEGADNKSGSPEKCDGSHPNTEIKEFGDGVIPITDSVDEIKNASAPSGQSEVENSAGAGAKVSKVDDDATIVTIETIPKDRLREIFKYANGTWCITGILLINLYRWGSVCHLLWLLLSVSEYDS